MESVRDAYGYERNQIYQVLLARQGFSEFETIAVKTQKLMHKFESWKESKHPAVDLGLRCANSLFRVAGRLLRAHDFDESFTMAIAFKMVVIYQFAV